MSSKIGNTLSVAIGAAFIGSLSLSQLAAASPAFQASDLATGYMLAAAGEGKCGEGKCGVEKMDTNKDGKVSMDEAKAAKMADLEQHFKDVDTNGDGFVDKAERQGSVLRRRQEEGRRFVRRRQEEGGRLLRRRQEEVRRGLVRRPQGRRGQLRRQEVSAQA